MSDLELKAVVSFLMCILGTNALPLEEQKVNSPRHLSIPRVTYNKGKSLMLDEACRRSAVKELILTLSQGFVETDGFFALGNVSEGRAVRGLG